MKKYIFIAAAAFLFSGYASMSQSNDVNRNQVGQDRSRSTDEKKLGDYDEIIIKKKNDDSNAKITIEIKDDKVLVNGKPIEVFVDNEVSVKVRSPRQYTLTAPGSPFRFPGNTWSLDNSDMSNGGAASVHPFLGVMTEGTPDGAKVISVTESSAASKAGLQKDDIITKINGKAIADHQQLSETIAALKPEDKIDIAYKRNGKENKTTAVLGKRSITTRRYEREYMSPDSPEAPEAPEPPEAREGIEAPIPPIPPMNFNFDNFGRAFNMGMKPRLGIRAQDTEDNKGVKVIGVDEESPAEKAGLKENDIITSFDDRKVNTSDELAEAARSSKDKSSIKIQLKRDGKTQDIELKVPRKLKTANL